MKVFVVHDAEGHIRSVGIPAATDRRIGLKVRDGQLVTVVDGTLIDSSAKEYQNDPERLHKLCHLITTKYRVELKQDMASVKKR